VGRRAGLNTVSKKKIPSFLQESNSDHPIVQPVYRLSYISKCSQAVPWLNVRLRNVSYKEVMLLTGYFPSPDYSAVRRTWNITSSNGMDTYLIKGAKL
jgi:hypothetical protein